MLSIPMIFGVWTSVYTLQPGDRDIMDFVGSLYTHTFRLFSDVKFNLALPSFNFNLSLITEFDWALLWHLRMAFFDFADFSAKICLR